MLLFTPRSPSPSRVKCHGLTEEVKVAINIVERLHQKVGKITLEERFGDFMDMDDDTSTRHATLVNFHGSCRFLFGHKIIV